MLTAVASFVLFGVVVGSSALMVLAVLTESGQDASKTWYLPPWLDRLTQRDEVAFPIHAILAKGYGMLPSPPIVSGLQWLKAAAHVRSDQDVRLAGEGLRAAISRVAPADRERAVAELCQAAARGHRTGHAMVAAFAGLRCGFELEVRAHVPEGQPIYYEHNPPTGGPHYDRTVPRYGFSADPILPGYWVHNLEHGAVVVLYQCDAACHELAEPFRELIRQLPANLNSKNGVARLLVLPDPNLPSALAMVAWGRSVLLDRFDADLITAFYEENVDRGPECRNHQCSE